MRKVTLPILLGLLLLPAAAAVAKEPVAAKICGKSDCTTVKNKDTLMSLFGGGGPADPPDRGTPWYSVRMAIDIGQDRPDHYDQVVVPSLGVVGGEDPDGGITWMSMARPQEQAYRRLTRGIEAMPARKLEGVGPAALPEAQVDEVVLPPDREPAAAGDDGGSSPLPWIAGGLVLLGLAIVLIRRRGLPWVSRPASP
jgi:hypothetical protein